MSQRSKIPETGNTFGPIHMPKSFFVVRLEGFVEIQKVKLTKSFIENVYRSEWIKLEC